MVLLNGSLGRVSLLESLVRDTGLDLQSWNRQTIRLSLTLTIMLILFNSDANIETSISTLPMARPVSSLVLRASIDLASM